MEIVKAKIKVIDNMLIIEPEDGFKDNSVYEIRLKNIKSLTDDELNENLKFYTKLTPLYVDIDSVKALIGNMPIPDDVILYHIREASRFADYIKTGIDEDNVPFEVSQFVRYKAAHECLLRHTVNLSSSVGISGTVGKVTFSEKETIRDVSKLLDHLCKEVSKWLDEVKGFKLEGRAEMKTAVRGGSYSYPGYDPVKVEIFDRLGGNS